MSSNALVGPPRGSDFAQQGTVDWVTLSNSTVNFSVEVLARFAKAGVEVITVAIGQAIFSTFNVPSTGQERVSKAISKLKAFSSYGDVLWFGFGVKHITKTLCETEQGSACVAICACLSVSYDCTFASQVLKASTDLSKTPGSLTPSLSQWGALTTVCAGAFADSQFPILVEGFSRLLRGNYEDYARQPLHTTTSAISLAGALQELSKVSNGNLRSVTIRGGVDCGWLSAVAQWLLCLRVEILDSRGNCLYSNFLQRNSYAQVTVIQQLSTVDYHEVGLVSGRSYFVPPGSLLFRVPNTHTESTHLYSLGRTNWDNIIRQTFGGAADELLNPKNANRLATHLCSRMIHSSAKAGIQSRTVYLNPWGEMSLTDWSQRQRAFMHFASVRLPELADAFKFTEAHGYEYAPEAFESCWAHICPCATCSPGGASNTNFCLKLIGHTIFRMLWILSWVDVEPSIRPASSGLLMMYYSIAQNRYESLQVPDLSAPLFSLFTGTTCDLRTIQRLSARTFDGICIYQQCLQEVDVSPSRILRLRVVPGQIEKNGATYESIQDARIIENKTRVGTLLPEALSKVGAKSQISLVLHETLNSKMLEALFYLQHTPDEKIVDFMYSHSEGKNLDLITTGRAIFQEPVGVCEMRNRIIDLIQISPCNERKVHITSTEAMAQTTDIWTGDCFNAATNLFNGLNEDFLGSLPKKGQWLIAAEPGVGEDPQDFSRWLFHGSYVLLYSVVLFLERYQATLLPIDSCFICSALSSRLSGTSERLFASFSMYSINDSQVRAFKLPRRVITRGYSQPPTSLSGFSYYQKTRKELQTLMARRGIRFKKNWTKKELIQLLQKHVTSHGSDSDEEVSGRNNQGGGTQDIDMSEYFS